MNDAREAERLGASGSNGAREAERLGASELDDGFRCDSSRIGAFLAALGGICGCLGGF